jgi:apolipoprotein N-acyltransferase
VREGASFIVNPTNGASYTGTIVQTQQIASSRLRAIETGRWVVQAAPTGFSAFISPDGEVIDRTSIGARSVIVHAVEIRTGDTWYTFLGDAPFIIALAVAFATVSVPLPFRRGGYRPVALPGGLPTR